MFGVDFYEREKGNLENVDGGFFVVCYYRGGDSQDQ